MLDRMFRFTSIDLPNCWHNTPLGAVAVATGCKFQVAYHPVFLGKEVTHTTADGIELFSAELESYAVGGLYHLCSDMKKWAYQVSERHLKGITLPADCESWELAAFVAQEGMRLGLEKEFNSLIYTLVIQDSW